MAKRSLIARAEEVFTTSDNFADIESSEALARIREIRQLGNQYRAILFPGKEGKTSTLILCPESYETYRHNFVYRALFWNSKINRYPSFALTSSGDLLYDESSKYDFCNSPTEVSIQGICASKTWTKVETLAMAPPCRG